MSIPPVVVLTLKSLSFIAISLASIIHYRSTIKKREDAKYFLLWLYLGTLIFQTGELIYSIWEHVIGKGSEMETWVLTYYVATVGLGVAAASLSGTFYIIGLWHMLLQTLNHNRFEALRAFANVPGRMRKVLQVIRIVHLGVTITFLIVGQLTNQQMLFRKILGLVFTLSMIPFILVSVPILFDLATIMGNLMLTRVLITSNSKRTSSSSANVIQPIAVMFLVIAVVLGITAISVLGNFLDILEYFTTGLSEPAVDGISESIIGLVVALPTLNRFIMKGKKERRNETLSLTTTQTTTK